MHRLIVTSATYRQASRVRPALLAPRPGEPAAGARTAVSAAGRGGARQCPGDRRARWSTRIGGPSIKPYQPAGLWEELAGGAGEAPYVQDKGPEALSPQPLRLPQADRPAPGHGHVRRPQPRDLPGQAAADQHAPPGPRALERRHLRRGRAATGAAHARTRAARSPDERITFAFRRALRADADRRRAGRVAPRAGAVPRSDFATDKAAAVKLIRHGESPPDPKIDPVVLAAYTATAGVILNLDETITLE